MHVGEEKGGEGCWKDACKEGCNVRCGERGGRVHDAGVGERRGAFSSSGASHLL